MGTVRAMERGALTISIDLELLWGVWDVLTPYHLARCLDRERDICQRLVDLFERHDAPVTWAVVGRLVDDSYGFDGLRGDARCWYAPDIVDVVRGSRVGHDVGSHSYAHIDFARAAPDAAAADIERARRAHDALGLDFTSFVFPRNRVGNLDALHAAGIRVYRSTDEGPLRWFEDHAPRLRPVANLADKALPVAAATVVPLEHESGMVELPSSLLLMGRNGARRLATPAALRSKLRNSIARAAERRECFHLWFHPSNFYEDAATQLDTLEVALVEAAKRRARGELDVRTMASYQPALAAAQMIGAA
jgi:hypothetical protein